MAGQLPMIQITPRLPQPVGNRKLVALILVNTFIIVGAYFTYREGLRRAQTPAYRDVPAPTVPYYR